MDDEEFGRRPPPSRYRSTGRVLNVSQAALEATLLLLREAGTRESCVFWYGIRDADGNGAVCQVIAPEQAMKAFNYSVTSYAITKMAHRVQTGFKPVAQIHSHPGRNVEHSRYDDVMASSKRALSFVFPAYGRGQIQLAFPDIVGVHEWQDEYWHLLSRDEARSRVSLIEAGDVIVEDMR